MPFLVGMFGFVRSFWGYHIFMKELLSTNDVVYLSFVQDLLHQGGIDFALFDANMSIIEGSIGILPRRVMVSDELYDEALQLIEKVRSEEPYLIDENQSEPFLAGEELTDDLFFGGDLKVLQPKKGFRSGIDAVLLAASVPDEGSMRVLEAGCGAGVVSLAIARRCQQATVDAVEIEEINVAVAEENVQRNDLSARVSIHLGDIYDPVTKLELSGLKRNSYDFVVANPPFYDEREMRLSDDPLRRRAKLARADTLEEWVRFLTAMAAPKGVISMIHRADKLDDILTVLSRRFGGVKILPLFPKANVPANRVIVQGVKGSRAPLTILQGIVLHDDEGQYWPDVQALCSGPLSLGDLTFQRMG